MSYRVPLRIAALLMLLAPLPAAAQMDPMEEQRCVWRCLSMSRGASDPAYDACVRRQCTARPQGGKAMSAPPPARIAPAQPAPAGAKSMPVPAAPVPAPARRDAWKTASDLGYPAVAQCQPQPGNANLCLVVSCPQRGALALELYGLAAGMTGAPMRISTAGALFDLTLPPRAETEEGYRWPMPLGLAPALREGSAATLEVAGRSVPLSLAGSGSAIGGVEARCR